MRGYLGHSIVWGTKTWALEFGVQSLEPELVSTVLLSSCVTLVGSLACRRVHSVKASYRIVGNV